MTSPQKNFLETSVNEYKEHGGLNFTPPESKGVEEVVDELLMSSSGLPYGIIIGFNQDVLGQRQGFHKYGGDELRAKLITLLTSRDTCYCKDKGVLELIEEEITTHRTQLLQEIEGEVRESLPEIVEKHFPKGLTAERGSATLLGCDILTIIRKHLKR